MNIMVMMRFFRRLFQHCLPLRKPHVHDVPLTQVVVESPRRVAPAPLAPGPMPVAIGDLPPRQAATSGGGVGTPLGPVPALAKPQQQKRQRKRKRTIPKAIRLAVWSKYIGEHIGVTKCPVCNTNDIGQLRFEVAHVVAEAKGGTLHIDNLRPICPTCNRSMGTTNLEEFKKRFFGDENA